MKKKKTIFLALKIIVSFGLLALLLFIVDWERTFFILQSVQITKLFFIPMITLCGIVFASFRWKLLLQENQIQVSFIDCYWGYWLGLFYSIFLPGVIGGDVIRVGLVVNKTRCSVVTSATIVLLERMVGIIVLFSTMAAILLVSPETVIVLVGTFETTQLIVIAIFILICLGIVLLGRGYWPKLIARFKQNKLVQFINKPLLTLSLISHKALIKSMLLSFLFEAADIFTVYFLAEALGFNLPLMFFFAIMPIVYVITILPISLGGLGIREGALVFFLSQTGVQASDAVTLSFMIYLNRIILGGIAGLIQLFKSMTKKPASL